MSFFISFVTALTFAFSSAVTDFTEIPDTNPRVVLAGYFTSCGDAETGGYGERIAVLRDKKTKQSVEFHMGPRDEFGLFANERDEHYEHDDKELNLLWPAFHASDVNTFHDKRNWWVESLNLKVNVARIPGTDLECYYFVVQVERGPQRQYAWRR